MDNKQPKVSLRKAQSQSWTDPVTGEIYPGGNPNEVPQPTQSNFSQPQSNFNQPQSNFNQPYPQQIPQSDFAQPQPNPQQNFAQNISVVPSSNIEVYPNGNAPQPFQNGLQPGMKFCKFCGQQIPMEAVLCVKCGRQVEQLQGVPTVNPQVVINNAPQPVVYRTGTPKNKWVAFFLCFFLGIFGAHRFYEGKVGTGLLWLFTFGVLGIGWLVDWITILTKPNTYYV